MPAVKSKRKPAPPALNAAMTVYLSREMLTELRTLAAARVQPVATVAREAIFRMLREHQHRSDSLAEADARDEPLLPRPRAADLIGQQFGRLTVLGEAEPRQSPDGRVDRCVTVRCTCGVVKVVRRSCLVAGQTKSCGCWRREVSVQHAIDRLATTRRVHGQARRNQTTRLYRVWTGIKGRCDDPKNAAFKHYGGRGITLWPAWASDFRVFEQGILAAIGPHPGTGYSIDRIDNEGNYEPGNVRWATASQQRRNQRPRATKPSTH